jgi:hypothetical protein
MHDDAQRHFRHVQPHARELRRGAVHEEAEVLEEPEDPELTAMLVWSSRLRRRGSRWPRSRALRP